MVLRSLAIYYAVCHARPQLTTLMGCQLVAKYEFIDPVPYYFSNGFFRFNVGFIWDLRDLRRRKMPAAQLG